MTSTEAAELARATGDAAGLGRAALGMPEVSGGALAGPGARLGRGAARDASRGGQHAQGAAPCPDRAWRSAGGRRHDDGGGQRGGIGHGRAARRPGRWSGPSAPASSRGRARTATRSGWSSAADCSRSPRRTRDAADVLWGRLWRFDALLQAGRVAGAEAELDLLVPVVAALRQPLAWLHLLRGRARWRWVAVGSPRCGTQRGVPGHRHERAARRRRGHGPLAADHDGRAHRRRPWRPRLVPHQPHAQHALHRAVPRPAHPGAGRDRSTAEARYWYAACEPRSPRLPAYMACRWRACTRSWRSTSTTPSEVPPCTGCCCRTPTCMSRAAPELSRRSDRRGSPGHGGACRGQA